MTAYQLRHHLADHHLVYLWGSPMHILVAAHHIEHQGAQDHNHDTEAGHLGNLESALTLVILFLFIIVLLRILGVRI